MIVGFRVNRLLVQLNCFARVTVCLYTVQTADPGLDGGRKARKLIYDIRVRRRLRMAGLSKRVGMMQVHENRPAKASASPPVPLQSSPDAHDDDMLHDMSSRCWDRGYEKASGDLGTVLRVGRH